MVVAVPDYLVLGEVFEVFVGDENSGNPVEGAAVTYSKESKQTGADGIVSFNAAKNSWTIKASKEGYKSVSVKRSVKKSGATPGIRTGSTSSGISLVLPEEIFIGETFIVQVIDANDNPVQDTNVFYGKQSVLSDSEGIAELTGEKNTYLIKAEKKGTGNTTEKIKPKKAQTTDTNEGISKTTNTPTGIDPLNILLATGVIAGIAIFIRGRKR